MRLTLCPCCHRHVKNGDSCCPFCGTQNAASGLPSAGLILALAVGAGTLAACGSSDSTPSGGGGSGGSPDKDATADTLDDSSFEGGDAGSGGVYGPPPDASLDAAYGPPPDDAAPDMMGAYGPPPDSGNAGSGGAYGPPPDAADEGMQGAYGPPPDGG